MSKTEKSRSSIICIVSRAIEVNIKKNQLEKLQEVASGGREERRRKAKDCYFSK